MTETQRNPLAKSFNAVSLIKFAFPSMVMMLFMGLYTIVDTIFAARFVDTNALSSINIVCPVINIIVGLGTMLGAGGSAIVAKKMGIKGAALGTSIGYIIPTGIGTVFFLTGRSELHFCKPKMDANVLIKSCSNGMSEMVSQLSAAVTTCLFNKTMMKLFLRLQKQGFLFFHLVSCFLGEIFLHLCYLRHYRMERYRQQYLSCGHLDLLRYSF